MMISGTFQICVGLEMSHTQSSGAFKDSVNPSFK